MTHKPLQPGESSRDATDSVREWKHKQGGPRQFLLHVAVVCFDDDECLKQIDDALDDIRNVAVADVYRVEELTAGDSRRLKR